MQGKEAFGYDYIFLSVILPYADLSAFVVATCTDEKIDLFQFPCNLTINCQCFLQHWIEEDSESV